MQIDCLEIAGCSQRSAAGNNLRLEKWWLLDQVKALGGTGLDFDAYHARSTFSREAPERPLIDPEIPVPGPRRSVAEEFSIDRGAIEARGGDAQDRVFGEFRNGEPEADPAVEVVSPRIHPQWFRGLELRGLCGCRGQADKTDVPTKDRFPESAECSEPRDGGT